MGSRNIDDILYLVEEEHLAAGAFKTRGACGREYPIEPDGMRSDFQRDRDRILHSKSFRRLTHKTQVFLDPEGDHYRTRLTHTLEVTQIARTIARALKLNEDLTEAASFGHDLGHAPFGHAGEKVLNNLCPAGFKHNEQSVRVVEKLENDFKGLNLTYQVREAIRCHTFSEALPSTLEGRVIRYADRIAYINHDIDDAVRAGIISVSDLPENAAAVLGNTHSERINSMVRSIIENSFEKNDISMTPEVQAAFDGMYDYLFKYVYVNNRAKTEESKAQNILRELYCHYADPGNPLPPEYERIAAEEGRPRAVCDYISGMTDRYAVNHYMEIFVPRNWGSY